MVFSWLSSCQSIASWQQPTSLQVNPFVISPSGGELIAMPDTVSTSKLDRALDIVVNKLHIFIGSLAHASLLIYHFKTHLDIPTGIQNAEYGFLAFLGAHALTYQKYPDTPSIPEIKG